MRQEINVEKDTVNIKLLDYITTDTCQIATPEINDESLMVLSTAPKTFDTNQIVESTKQANKCIMLPAIDYCFRKIEDFDWIPYIKD